MKASRIVPSAVASDTLGLEDAARMLRLGLEAMKELVDRGDVPAVRLNQKHTVMLREDLIDFLRREGRRQAAERKQRKTQLPPYTRQLPKRAARRPSPPDLRPYEID
ncbi:helix-turn-helix domain-containing protein [Stenotrophomonas maltophilia]|uniref:helix-turn-helix domain-containing protein n=1 Tax=Stenotrophomonas maltophilia TaxID=40324 RepID=UPI003CCFE84B